MARVFGKEYSIFKKYNQDFDYFVYGIKKTNVSIIMDYYYDFLYGWTTEDGGKADTWKRAIEGVVCSYPENIFEIKELKFSNSKFKVSKEYFQKKIKIYVCSSDIGEIEFECRTIDYLNSRKELNYDYTLNKFV